jgi:hypothetical protein
MCGPHHKGVTTWPDWANTLKIGNQPATADHFINQQAVNDSSNEVGTCNNTCELAHVCIMQCIAHHTEQQHHTMCMQPCATQAGRAH